MLDIGESYSQIQKEKINEIIQKHHNIIESERLRILGQINEVRGESLGKIFQKESEDLYYYYYGKILGREPSTEEYEALIERRINGDKIEDIVTEITSSVEYAEKLQLKQDVTNKVGELLSGNISDLGLSLGCDTQNLITLTDEDKETLTSYLLEQNLHFGASAYQPVLNILTNKGIEFDKKTVISELILYDFLKRKNKGC